MMVRSPFILGCLLVASVQCKQEPIHGRLQALVKDDEIGRVFDDSFLAGLRWPRKSRDDCFTGPAVCKKGNPDKAKVRSITFRYTGLSCDVSNNFQDGKATCDGDPAFTSPVLILMSGKDGLVYFFEEVTIGSDFVVPKGGSEFPLETLVMISTLGGTILQELTIDTSCSQPLAVVNDFGCLEVMAVDIVPKEGSGKCEPTSSPSPTPSPSIVPPLPSKMPVAPTSTPTVLGTGEDECTAVCEKGNPDKGEIKSITFRYTGLSCDVSNNFQDGKATCDGDPSFASPVLIELTSKDGSVYFSEEVSIGSDFVVSNGGSKFPLETLAIVSTLGGTVLQELTIDTSCSQPLAVVNDFGCLEVMAVDVASKGNVKCEPTSLPMPSASPSIVPPPPSSMPLAPTSTPVVLGAGEDECTLSDICSMAYGELSVCCKDPTTNANTCTSCSTCSPGYSLPLACCANNGNVYVPGSNPCPDTSVCCNYGQGTFMCATGTTCPS